MLFNLFFVRVRVAQFIFCGDSCCSIYFFVGVHVVQFIFVRVRVAQFIFCGRSCCSIFTYISVL